MSNLASTQAVTILEYQAILHQAGVKSHIQAMFFTRIAIKEGATYRVLSQLGVHRTPTQLACDTLEAKGLIYAKKLPRDGKGGRPQKGFYLTKTGESLTRLLQ